MILVIDTNIVFSGMLRESITRELLIDSPFTLYAPETMIKEIRKYDDIILKRSELAKEDFEILFRLLTDNINIVEKEHYSERIQEADALTPEPLMLSDEKSLWGSDIYIAVSKEVPGAEMARVSGSFLTNVFEGPYKDTGKWVKEMKAYVKSKGKEMKSLYFFYTTCPKCAKAYGKNYTVILAEV